MIRAVIFDFDGTLVDSEPINITAALKTFRDFGYPLSEAQQKQIPGQSSRDFIPLFLRDFGLPPELFENLYKKNKENYRALWNTDMAMLMPFVRTTVTILHDHGIRLAIVTNNNRAIVEKFIARFHLCGSFSYFLTSEDVAFHKPHPEPYSTMKKFLRVSDSEIIAVEDTEHGLASAKDAGLSCAVVPTRFSRHHDFSRADFVLSSLRELPAIIFRH